MSVDLKFIPLTFITSNEEILKQIKNTVLFSYLLSKNEETSLNYYLETTQYGFTASALGSGSHKLVRITDINNGKVDWNTVPFCNCSDDNKYLLRDHDILVARTGGTTGKSFIVNSPPKNAVFASYLIRLRLNKNANIDFITCFLNSYLFWSQIIEMKSGSAMPNVNAEKLKTLKLPKCDIKTQREIILAFQNEQNRNELSGLYQKVNSIEILFKDSNELSSNLNYQQDLLIQLRQSFLSEAMQGKLVKQDPKDGHAKDLLQKIKAEKAKSGKKERELPPIKPEEIPFEIPGNWVWARLGDICSKIGSGSTPKGSNYTKTGIPFFRSQNVYDEGLIYEDIKYISDEVHSQMSGTTVFSNDILLNITGGSLGRCSLVQEDFKEGNVSQHVCIIRPVQFSNRFLHKVILSPFFQKLIFKSTTGAGREGLPKYNLEQFLVPIPPIPEQSRIVKKLTELMNLCDDLQQSIQDTREQNDLLLQQVLKEALMLNK
ncbi:restriction endonuclease subunit S [Flavihumibacter sp. RY-1]|uniref:Restriction endonuclease subunit S n=1 Tax=Flavihumibacter fluminis TaxID=2909236 RepID=A0ABS9BFD1_9BACT|nr:restriction endonuclease subunit S [Flavihumibacter fluminis]MCF1714419.1 restriction endonuclease subunit S [Flavihumibacter fluminis]